MTCKTNSLSRNKKLNCRSVAVVTSAILLFCQGIDINLLLPVHLKINYAVICTITTVISEFTILMFESSYSHTNHGVSEKEKQ